MGKVAAFSTLGCSGVQTFMIFFSFVESTMAGRPLRKRVGRKRKYSGKQATRHHKKLRIEIAGDTKIGDEEPQGKQ